MFLSTEEVKYFLDKLIVVNLFSKVCERTEFSSFMNVWLSKIIVETRKFRLEKIPVLRSSTPPPPKFD